jgi:heavy metal sensor kinase
MRSIRLSLMVYFLGLLAVALGVASFLVYRTAQSTLEAKEKAARTLVEAQFEERSREADNRLDRRLLAQAQSLAGRTRPQWRWDRIGRGELHCHGLGILLTHAGPFPYTGSLLNVLQLAPNWPLPNLPPPPRPPRLRGRNEIAHVAGLVGIASAPPGPAPQLGRLLNVLQLAPSWPTPRPQRPRWPFFSAVQVQLWHHEMIDLTLGGEVEVPEDSDTPRIAARIQTNGWSRPLFPPNGPALALPDESDFEPDARLTWKYDHYGLADDVPVRRVRFRALLNLQDAPAPGPGRGLFNTGYRAPPPALIIQCAANFRELQAIQDDLRKQRDDELAALHAETTTALVHQRNRLVVISLVTFAATVLGTFVLVWLGLLPLRRVSDAVSKVSVRDFQLHLGGQPLPQELRPIVERLTGTLELLKRAFAREKQATADISHELRTPLAALLTTTELALRKPRSPEQYREFFEDCRLSAQQMNHIVERLLTLARLDAGVDRLRPQPVDLAELAHQCAAVVRPLAEARGLHLSVYPPATSAEQRGEGAARMLGDPDKLREVLNNLLHNAIQYNRPEGRIDLKVARDNGHMRLEVQDTGIGIAPEARERIFERFYRADPSRNADDLHAGLGLAIVKEYIDLMGGTIAVESAEGQGSTFRVELPVATPAKAG